MTDPSSPTPAPQTPGQSDNPAAEIIARPGRRYRFTHFILVLIAFGAAAYCAYDGFVAYPAEKAKYDQAGKPYPALNIPFNQCLGLALPPLAVGLLIWTLYHSRGAYRLSGQTLHIPGHPPIPLDSIRRIDKRKWDKKGIAYIEYEPPGTTQTRRFRFDDYRYDYDPADKIFQRIEEHVRAMA
jgi:hypothetical protein